MVCSNCILIPIKQKVSQMSSAKTLDIENVEQLKEKVSDVKIFGNGNLFQVLSKASSESQGWMKSTKAMELEGGGCVVQVSTQQKNPDGSYEVAEAVTFVPYARIVMDEETGHLKLKNSFNVGIMTPGVINAGSDEQDELEKA